MGTLTWSWRGLALVMGLLLLFPSVHGVIILEIQDIVINGETVHADRNHEVSNDTNYISTGKGQNATIKVSIRATGGQGAVANVSMHIFNSTSTYNPANIFTSRNITIPDSGNVNTTTFVWPITSLSNVTVVNETINCSNTDWLTINNASYSNLVGISGDYDVQNTTSHIDALDTGITITSATGALSCDTNILTKNATYNITYTAAIGSANGNTSLETGIYNVSVNVTYYNGTKHKNVTDQSEYIKLVRVENGSFTFKNAFTRFSAGSNDDDKLEFYQEVTNTGKTSATIDVEFSIHADATGDKVFSDPAERVYLTLKTEVLPPGNSTTKTFVYEPTTSKATCTYSNDSGWLAQSSIFYGKYIYASSYSLTAGSRLFSMEYLGTTSPSLHGTTEYAPGDSFTAMVTLQNMGISDATLKERKAWFAYGNGTVIMDLSNSEVEDVSFTGYTPKSPSSCPIVNPSSQQFSFPGILPAWLSPSGDYKVFMAFDNGIPRGEYIDTSIEVNYYSEFNIKDSVTDFEIVNANLTNIYRPDEVAYGINANITTEVENLASTPIDGSSPQVFLKVENSSLGYLRQENNSMTISASQKRNMSISWIPQSGTVSLGSYNITSWYEFGRGGKTTKTSSINVISLVVKTVNTTPVAPYESTVVNVTIRNRGPSNATVTSLTSSIEAATSQALGTQNRTLTPNQNYSFFFNYSFDPTGLTNGSFAVKNILSYGGTSTTDTSTNITLLPVGIKSFDVPLTSTRNSSFQVPLVLKNIGNSNVIVLVNLSNSTVSFYSNYSVTVPKTSEKTILLNVTLNQSGNQPLNVTVVYQGLPYALNRSGMTYVSATGFNSFSAPTILKKREVFTASAVLENTGGTATDVNLSLSSSKAGSIENRTVNVPAGGQNNTNFTLSLNQTGSHTLNITGNYTGLAQLIQRSLTIYILPVEFTNLTIPQTSDNITSFDVVAVITNVNTTNMIVYLNLSSNVSGSIENKTITVNASSSKTVTFNVTLNQTGVHLLNITLSYSGLPVPIANSSNITITEAKPDVYITTSGISLSDATPTVGEDFNITATVYNGGSLSASSVKVELKINGTSQANNTISIGAGSSNSTRFSWVNSTAGNYNITVVVDPDNSISELNETNNNATKSYTVSVYTPPGQVIVGGGGGGGVRVAAPVSEGMNALTTSTFKDIITSKGLTRASYVEAPALLAGALISSGEYIVPQDANVRTVIKSQVETMAGDVDVYEISAERVLDKFVYANTIIVARGDLSPDSMAAIAYAKMERLPILLTEPNDLPDVTLTAIQKLGAKKVIIVGGEEAVETGVQGQIPEKASIERIGGETRYETAVMMAERITSPKTIVITNGEEPSTDAALMAAIYKAPLVYVTSTGIPDATREFLSKNILVQQYLIKTPMKVVMVGIEPEVAEDINKLMETKEWGADIQVYVKNEMNFGYFVDLSVDSQVKTKWVDEGGKTDFGSFHVEVGDVTLKAKWFDSDPDVYAYKEISETLALEPGDQVTKTFILND